MRAQNICIDWTWILMITEATIIIVLSAGAVLIFATVLLTLGHALNKMRPNAHSISKEYSAERLFMFGMISFESDNWGGVNLIRTCFRFFQPNWKIFPMCFSKGHCITLIYYDELLDNKILSPVCLKNFQFRSSLLHTRQSSHTSSNCTVFYNFSNY